MSFVIISAYNALYGPTAISTEDSVLHEQISSSQLTNALTISRRRHKHDVIFFFFNFQFEIQLI